MNTETGEIRQMDADAFKAMDHFERAKYIPVRRDLSALEESNKQIMLYSKCGCGSDKNFKFCCYKPKP